jgi:hypothetical protein
MANVLSHSLSATSRTSLTLPLCWKCFVRLPAIAALETVFDEMSNASRSAVADQSKTVQIVPGNRFPKPRVVALLAKARGHVQCLLAAIGSTFLRQSEEQITYFFILSTVWASDRRRIS